jgi:FRG domain
LIEEEIIDVSSFLSAARQVLAGFGQTSYWYRGHGDSTWRLVPTVHRDYDAMGEHNLLARFRLSAPTRHATCPPRDDLAGWLTLMQHFGLPTRLLDWTTSPLVGLYFAVSGMTGDGPGALWALSPSELNRHSTNGAPATFVLTGPEAQPLLQSAFHLATASPAEILAVVGHDVDLRMSVQQGAFTIHGSDEPIESRPDASSFLAKFVIPPTAKSRLAEELRCLGIRRSVLFPDLQNLAADLLGDGVLIPRKAAPNQPLQPASGPEKSNSSARG